MTDSRKGLIEVDLQTLQVVAQEQFPFSISALSEAKHPTPLTLGTTLSLHLHDPRVSLRKPPAPDDRVDPVSLNEEEIRIRNFQRIFAEPSPIYASLFHPGPLSICELTYDLFLFCSH